MRQKKFNSYKDVAKFMLDQYHADMGTTVVMFANETEKVVRELLKHDSIKLGIIDFESNDFEYTGEYIVQLGYDGELSVEHAIVEDSDEYYFINGDVILLDGDVNSAIIRKCESDAVFEIVIKESNDESCDDPHEKKYTYSELTDMLFDGIFRFLFEE